MDLQSHPIRNHLPMAERVVGSVRRYIEMLKKGYARPSLAADSALMMWRSSFFTFLMAYCPPIKRAIWIRNILSRRTYLVIPTMVCATMGSVGVSVAAITRADMKDSCGNKPLMIPKD